MTAPRRRRARGAGAGSWCSYACCAGGTATRSAWGQPSARRSSGQDGCSASGHHGCVDATGAAVPTCPRWTVHDVVAHLTGVCADILTGNLEGVATDPWTEAQVSSRKNRTMAELVEEWNELGPQVEAITAAFPGRAAEQ